MKLIDADRLEDEIRFMCFFYDWEKIGNVIHRQPTVDPVKHGHWILEQFGEGDDAELWYQCSQCGWPTMSNHSNYYCPHCGAKMDEVAE